MNKKSLGIILLTVFLINMLAPAAATAETSISNLTVRPEKNTVGEYTRYQITFSSNETLTGGIDTVQIRFPSQFRFTNTSWQSGYADIKGMASGGVEYNNGLLVILVPRNTTVYAGETVIVNLSSAIMRNPETSGEYSLSVNTSKETTPISSPRFVISEYVNPDGVSKPHVTLSPVQGYQAEEIKIQFNTNQNGQLIGSVDQIVLDFPNGVRLPQTIDPSTIKINSIQMYGLSPVVVGQRLILPLSPTMNYAEMQAIEIVIGANAGVTVTRDETDVNLYVSTTRNTAVIESFPFGMNRTPDQIYQPADGSDPAVLVTPNGAGALGQWVFTFPKNSILLTEGQSVMGFTITFPNGTILPGSIAGQHVTVNGQQSTGVLVNPSRRELIFTLPIGFSVFADMTVVVASSAGIQNPPAAVYRMEVMPLKGTRTITTKSFEIKTVSDAVPNTQNPTLPADRIVKLSISDPVAVKDGLAVILDVAPQLIDGFTMVPLRFVSEGIGAVVHYDSTQNTVTLTLGSRVIVLWPGSTLAKVDNVVVTLAKAPFLIDGRTMVPLRFVSECFGAQVTYVNAQTPITITMTADALAKMPTVAEIQAAQAGAAGSNAGGANTGTTPGTTPGTAPGQSAGGSAGDNTGAPADPGAGTGVTGRTVTLKTGSNNANLRKGPGTDYDVVGLLLPSETAKIIEISSNWYHIEFSYGLKAWIRNDLVEVQ